MKVGAFLFENNGAFILHQAELSLAVEFKKLIVSIHCEWFA